MAIFCGYRLSTVLTSPTKFHEFFESLRSYESFLLLAPYLEKNTYILEVQRVGVELSGYKQLPLRKDMRR